jgi:DNA polymerase III subunit beta
VAIATTALHLSISAPELAEAVARVARVVPSRAHMPVLAGILCETDGQALQLTATNLEAGIRIRVPAEVRGQGAVVVPAKLFAGALAGLPDEPVELALEPDTLTLRLRCARYRASIRCLDAADFPPGPQAEGGDRLTVELADLLDGIEKTVGFASTDDNRPVYTAVLFRIAKDGLTLVSSDGHRLAECRLPVDSDLTEELRLLVPARAAHEIPRAFKGAAGDVEMVVSKARNQVFFRAGESEVSSRLLDGQYPNYTTVIPVTWTTAAVLATGDLKAALAQAGVFTDDRGAARLQVTSDGLVITAETNEVGDSVIELAASVTGTDAETRLNVHYLADVLGVIGPRVELRLNGPKAPALVVDPDDDGYQHIVMAVAAAGAAR